MRKIAVLASGRGSNFEAILAAVKSGKLEAEITAVLSDQPDALVLDLAKKAGIPAVVVPGVSKSEASDLSKRRELHDHRVLKALSPHSPEFLVMAGYMRVVSSVLIEAFRCKRGYSKIVNVHPSLLPAFPGVQSYAQAFFYGARIAEVTVHLVEESVDSGPICAQESFAIDACQSAKEVERLGLEIEHRLYPETLNWVLSERFEVVERVHPVMHQRRLCVRPY